MVEEGTYEIMPYKEIVALKRDITELKKKSGEAPSRDLLNSMNNLTKSMEGMLQLFRTAAEEMKAEESVDVNKQLAPMKAEINKLSEQSKTIAEGMVAIADMVKEMKEGKKTEESMHIPSLGAEHSEHKEEHLGMPPPIEPEHSEHKEEHLGMPPPIEPEHSDEPLGMPPPGMPPPHMPPPGMPPPHMPPPPGMPPEMPAGPMGGMGDMPLEPMPGEKPKKGGFFNKLFKKK